MTTGDNSYGYTTTSTSVSDTTWMSNSSTWVYLPPSTVEVKEKKVITKSTSPKKNTSPIVGGWGWPEGSEKAHFFKETGLSLCTEWCYLGSKSLLDTTDILKNSPDDCDKCYSVLLVLS